VHLRLGTSLLGLKTVLLESGTVPLGFRAMLLGLALGLGPSLALVSSWPLFRYTEVF